MDLIEEHPAVFQKSVANAALNFQMPLFQFVPKQNQINRDMGAVSAESHATSADFMALNGDFLSTGDKGFCGAVTNNHIQTEGVSVQQLPSLSLLAAPNVTLNDTGDIMYARSSTARKVLPHKKRISRKLKTEQDDDEPVVALLNEQHKLPEERLATGSTFQFSCELCGHSTDSQLSFFAHLKQHYEPEPSNTDTILAAMKNSIDVLKTEKNGRNICSVNKNSDGVADSVDQVFHDVHLNFANFHNVDESVRAVMNASQEHNMKIINSNSIDKCINYVSQTEATPLKDISAVEVEFSDNEDMLEGIRNVVDKVSIEDTCDIDLISSTTGIRTPWFTNDTFKSKSFAEISFSSAIDPLPVAASAAEMSPLGPRQLIRCASPLIKISDPKSVLLFPDASAKAEQADIFSTNTDCINAPVTTIKSEPREILYQSGGLPDDECSSSDANAFADDGDYVDDKAGQSIINSKKIKFCAQCCREFNSANALKYHLGTHSDVRPYKCDTCDKSFLTKSNLTAHKRIHTGDKPYECKHCYRRFGQWSDLKYHTQSIHSDEKSYQCEFCGKAFSRKYSLVLHRSIHTRERNYKCDFCEKTFRASTYLQNHRKIHTGEKPHECKVCSKKFRLPGDLKRHTRIHDRTSLPKKKANSDTAK